MVNGKQSIVISQMVNSGSPAQIWTGDLYIISVAL